LFFVERALHLAALAVEEFEVRVFGGSEIAAPLVHVLADALVGRRSGDGDALGEGKLLDEDVPDRPGSIQRIERRAAAELLTVALGVPGETRALPAEVWIDSETLSIGDFAATFAAGDGRVHRGILAFEKYVSTDACRNFNWVIHPEGFCAPELYELARVEAWTIKPAKPKPALGVRQSR